MRNPLRVGLRDERAVEPGIVVIFGAVSATSLRDSGIASRITSMIAIRASRAWASAAVRAWARSMLVERSLPRPCTKSTPAPHGRSAVRTVTATVAR